MAACYSEEKHGLLFAVAFMVVAQTKGTPMFRSKKTETPQTPRMLIATVHELPGRSYDVLGLVTAEVNVETSHLNLHFDIEKLRENVEKAAREMGGDAVIGLQVVSLPLVGKGNYALFGTAIKFRE